MRKIYLIEDEAPKREFLPEIIQKLNASIPEGEERFVDGFNGRSDAALLNPQLLLKAAQDKNGICLVDIYHKGEEYEQTALQILDSLRLKGRQADLQRFEQIKKVYIDDPSPPPTYWLSSAILSVCKEQHTHCLVTSTIASGPIIDRLNRLGFANEFFPYSEHSRNLVDSVVKAIKEVWYKDEWLSYEDFLPLVENLSHAEIHLQGKAGHLLRRFLRLPEKEFLCVFGTPQAQQADDPKALRSEVIDALKNISGLMDKEQNVYEGRPIALDGIWILALGVYRQLFPRNDWQEIFDVKHLKCLEGTNFTEYPHVHPPQKDKDVRRRTLILFCKMCEVLFPDRKPESNKCMLERVALQPQRLSFIFSFPAKELRKKIAFEARHASGETGVDAGHDSSQAIWRFWAATSFSDTPTEENDVDHTGAFGTQPRINVFDRNTKTEVRFGG